VANGLSNPTNGPFYQRLPCPDCGALLRTVQNYADYRYVLHLYCDECEWHRELSPEDTRALDISTFPRGNINWEKILKPSKPKPETPIQHNSAKRKIEW
jgi:hypothetical protein